MIWRQPQNEEKCTKVGNDGKTYSNNWIKSFDNQEIISEVDTENIFPAGKNLEPYIQP